MRRPLILGPALLAMAMAALPAHAAPSSGTSGMPACDVCTAQMTGSAQEQAAAAAKAADSTGTRGGGFAIILRRDRHGWTKY